MQAFHVRRRHGAAIVRITTQGDHVIRLFEKLWIDELRLMMRNVNAHFAHHLHSARIQAVRLDACAMHLHPVSSQMARPSFGHLASARVASAQKVNSLSRHVMKRSSPLMDVCTISRSRASRTTPSK